MPSHDEMAMFVRDALGRGLPRHEIRAALEGAGWRPEQVAAALGRYAESAFAVPVPRPKPYLSPREAFIYLVLFCALYTSAYQLGSLIFDLINRAYPDPLLNYSGQAYTDYARQAMRWSIACLVVAFPLFLFMASLTGRDVRRDPAKRASPVRRWLTYLTLFIAATALIADVTTLVYNVLGGELSTRFLLKVLTVAVIAGAGFGYYLRDLRQDEVETAA
jgi:hypothetical protein